MDRIESRGRRAIRRLTTAGALSLVGFSTGGPLTGMGRPEARAESPRPGPTSIPARPSPSWQEALTRTRAEGIPTVLLVTSKAVPASTAAARSIVSGPAAERLRGLVVIAELCVEDEPGQAKNLMVTRFPTVVGLKQGAAGKVVLAGSRVGAMSGEELVGWVEGVGLADPSNPPADGPPAASDRGLVRTGLFFGHDAPAQSTAQAPAASPQNPAPPPPVKTVPLPPPPPPPPIEREVVVERPVEREVVIEREVVVEAPPPPREVVREIVVEAAPQPAPTQVVREIVVESAPAPAQPRDVTAAPRNVLTRSVPVRERQVVVQPSTAPRTVTTREVSAAPRQVVQVVREVSPAPTQVVQVVRDVTPAPTQTVQLIREVSAAPTQTVQLVREVSAAPTQTVQLVREVAAAPAQLVEAAPAQAVATRGVGLGGQRPVNLIRPGFIGRALGGVGNRLRVAALPRIDVAEQSETRYVPVAPHDRAVYLSDTSAPQTYAVEAEASPPQERHRRHVCGPHCPDYQPQAPPPAPAYTPPYAPSPQSR